MNRYCLALVTLCLLVRVTAAAPKVLKWPSPVGRAAVSPAGMVATIGPDKDVAILYPKLTTDGAFDGVIESEVGPKPTLIVHKQVGPRGYFVVYCNGDFTLYLLDDQTGKLVRPIALETREVLNLTVPSSDKCPWIYFLWTQTTFSGYGRADLAAMTAIPTIGNIPSEREMRCSPDGTMFYSGGLQPGRVSSTLKAGPNGEPRAGEVFSKIDNHKREFVVDPQGRFVAANEEICTPDLREVTATLDGPVSVILQKQPVLFAQTPKGLVPYSTNTFKPLGKATVPLLLDEENKRRLRMNPSEVGRISVLVDEASDTLLQWNKDALSLLKLDELKLKAEPVVALEWKTATDPRVGLPWSLQMTSKDPAAKLKLANAPAGVKLVDSHLEWTPVASDVGPAGIVVEIASGEIRRTQSIDVNVRWGEVTLPFETTQAVAVDEKTLAVANLRVDDGRGQLHKNGREDDAAGIRLIDIAGLSVRAQTSLAADISAKATDLGTDGHQLFIAVQEQDAPLVFDLKDLSPRPPVAPTREIRWARGHSPYKFEPRLPPTYRSKPTPPSDWTGSGWYRDGLILDPDFIDLVMIEYLASIPYLVGSALKPGGVLPSEAQLTPWGVHAGWQSLVRDDGKTLAKWPDSFAAAVLDAAPVAVSLSCRSGGRKRSDGARNLMEVRVAELTKGQPVATLRLMDEPALSGEGLAPPMSAKITQGNTYFAFSVGPHVFVVRHSEMGVDKIPAPLHIVSKQSRLMIGTTGRVEMAYQIEGGTLPYRCSLTSEKMAGVTLDAAAGKMTIDAAALLAPYDTRVRSILLDLAKNKAAIDQNRDQAHKITGHDPKGVVCALPLTVSVTDSAGANAELSHLLLIDLGVK